MHKMFYRSISLQNETRKRSLRFSCYKLFQSRDNIL